MSGSRVWFKGGEEDDDGVREDGMTMRGPTAKALAFN